MRRHRRRTGLAHHRRQAFRSLQIKVGGFQTQRAVGGIKQNIGKDGDRVAAFHHPVDARQGAQKRRAIK
jgi:hypothetical protein